MQLLKTEELKPHPMNEYFFDEMTGQKYEEFKESVRTSGVIEPLIITQDMVIVSGHQRRRACIDEGIKEVWCEMRHYTDRNGRSKDDWILKDLIETNVRQRGEIGGSELKAVHRVDELRRIYGIQEGAGRPKIRDNVPNNEPVDVIEVAKAAGIDYESYKKLKALGDLIPDWQQLLESGNVSTSVAARIIAKLPADKQAELLESLPEEAKQRLTAKEASRYIAMLEQQQQEYEEQAAQIAKNYQKEREEMDKEYEAKSIQVLEQEETIRKLKSKGDPQLIAAMDKLKDQSRRDYETAQGLRMQNNSLQGENKNLQRKIKELEKKRQTDSEDMNELLSQIEELQNQLSGEADNEALIAAQREAEEWKERAANIERETCDRINAEKDRKILELQRKIKDLQMVEKERSTPSQIVFETPYSMPSLLRFLSEMSEQVKLYAISDALNVNSKQGDVSAVVSLVHDIEDNMKIINTKLKEIA